MWNRLLFSISLLTFIVILPASQTLAAATIQAPYAAATIDPTLRELVDAGTETAVSVIVQKYPGQTESVEAYVTELGGQVTLDLPIINGFAAELPQTAVDQLAQHPYVKHISPDAELSKSDAIVVERPDPGTVVAEPVDTEQVDRRPGDFSNPVIGDIVEAPAFEAISQAQDAGHVVSKEGVQRTQPAASAGANSAISGERQTPMMQTNGTSTMTGNLLANPGFENGFDGAVITVLCLV